MTTGFLPAFEKIGKKAHVYLTRDDIMFMHNVLHADGVQAIAQFPKEVLFEEYRISSQNDDRIAFEVDLGLLAKALKSGLSMDVERLQVKLVKKCPSPTEPALPYLTFESKGYRAAILQDVPISQPLTRAEVHDLQVSVDLVQDLPQTLVQLPELMHLQALVERLRSVGEILDVGVSQSGDLSLRVVTATVTIGTEFRRLRVWGDRTDYPTADDALGPSERLQQAIGVAPNDACLLMMFQYSEDNISLQYRLPVLDQTDD
eukprot:jgi/Mesen1/5084/ME000252S04193